MSAVYANEQIATPLDMWSAISHRYSDFTEEKVIEECRICLDIQEGQESFVELSYYELTNPEVIYDEEPKIKRFRLQPHEVQEMFREIKEIIELPSCVYKLYTELNSHRIPVFRIEMTPILKSV